jgi:hypothetical protein
MKLAPKTIILIGNFGMRAGRNNNDDDDNNNNNNNNNNRQLHGLLYWENSYHNRSHIVSLSSNKLY